MNVKKQIKLHKYLLINIDKLKHLPNNNRVHDEEQIRVLKDSINEYGITYPVLIDKNNNIIAGEGITKALTELDYKEIPCMRIENMSDEQVRLYRIMDNVSFTKGKMDMEAILKELADMKIAVDDLYLTGLVEGDINLETYNDMIDSVESDIDNLLTNSENFNDDSEDDDNDDISSESIIENVFVNNGDIWELDGHRLLCGDSENESNYNKLFKNDKISLLLTDPPYAVDYGEKNKYLNKFDKGDRIESDIKNDGTDSEKIKHLLINAFINVKKYFSEYSSYYIFMAINDNLLEIIVDVYKQVGFPIRHLLVWNKNNHVMGRCDYFYKHEPIIYGWIDKHKFYAGGEQRTTVINCDKPSASKIHPTEKPVKLLENFILNSTIEEDIVADIFGGSGSTLFACENTKRYCRIIEQSPEYCSYIIDKWEKTTGKKAVKLEGDNNEN